MSRVFAPTRPGFPASLVALKLSVPYPINKVGILHPTSASQELILIELYRNAQCRRSTVRYVSLSIPKCKTPNKLRIPSCSVNVKLPSAASCAASASATAAASSATAGESATTSSVSAATSSAVFGAEATSSSSTLGSSTTTTSSATGRLMFSFILCSPFGPRSLGSHCLHVPSYFATIAASRENATQESYIGSKTGKSQCAAKILLHFCPRADRVSFFVTATARCF